MPSELPYLPSYKNVGKLFEKIHDAKRPESFTNKFLYDTIGLKSVGDRPLITMLKNLGFLDGSSKPTPRYDALKNDALAGKAIAQGIREAYAPLFAANENAHKLDRAALKGLVAQVSGADTNTTKKILGTLTALLNIADFSESPASQEKQEEEKGGEERSDFADTNAGAVGLKFQGMDHQFHYNIQVHLPANGSEETYLNIFNALRKVFK